MTINNISGAYRATSTIAAPKVKASEEGLFKPITAKVSGALSDEYVEQIKACASKAAADGTDVVIWSSWSMCIKMSYPSKLWQRTPPMTFPWPTGYWRNWGSTFL